jgi:hypothetical protein
MTSIIFDTVWEVPRHMRGAVESSFYLQSNAIDDASPWTGERTPYGPYAQAFLADIKPAQASSPAKARAGEVTWREWQGFMTRLRGTSGKMRIVDYYRMRPVYDARVSPDVSNWSDGSHWSDGSGWAQGALPPYVTLAEAAREDDDSIVLQGLPVNTDMVLNPSDLIEMRPNGVATSWSNLYEVVHCARTNADGKTRVYIQPGLRQGLAVGDVAVLRFPTGVFRLADATQGIVTRSLGNVGSLGFKLIESLRDA